jgi:hypothetical protein
VQSRLHEIPDQEIVEDFVIDRRHQAVAGKLEGDAAAILAVQRDEVGAAAGIWR